MAWVSSEQNTIWTFAPGTTRIYAESGDIRSNTVSLEVVDIERIDIEPVELEIAVGGRSSLSAVCTLRDGTTVEDASLIWTEDNTDIARVSSAGSVFGAGVGETHVTAGDDRCFAQEAARLRVVEGQGRGPGDKGHGSVGFPRILVSGGFQQDPDTGEDVYFRSDEPPVTQRAEDATRNIWWINTASPMAKLYLDDRDQFGYESVAWRMYHVERLVDVLVHVLLQERHKEDLSIDDWSYYQGDAFAELQKHIVTDLKGFISDGTPPSDPS